MKISADIKLKSIDDIIPYYNNPKEHPSDQIDKIASSIKNYGFVQPIVIDADNEIIIGHGRLKAAKKLNMKEVPVVIKDDLTDAEIRALRIADNKVAESEWNLEALEVEFELLDDEFTGFDIEELDFLDDEEVEEDNFTEEVDEDEPTITELGDVIELGSHRLMCGDSTKKANVEKLMNGETAEISFTSPPYNVGKSAVLSGTTHMSNNKYKNYKDNNEQYYKLLQDFTRLVLSNADYNFINIQHLSGNKIELIDYLYYFKNKLVDTIIWDKQHAQPAMAQNVLNSRFEYIFIFNKENATRSINTGNFRGTVDNVYTGNPQRNNNYSDIHSATFPIDLPSWIIKNFSYKKDNVIDLFGGTGTTLIASEQLDRTCYMMELDEHYCDVIIRRYINYKQENNEEINIKVNGEKIDYTKYLKEV